MNRNCKIEYGMFKRVTYVRGKSNEHVYTGVVEGHWIQYYYNHTISIRKQGHRNDTTSSTFL